MAKKENCLDDNDCLFHKAIITPLKLQELAAVAVATRSWKQDASGFPESQKINKYIKKMNEEKEKWFNYLGRVFSTEILENVEELMVWSQNGTLDYKKTAKNMFKNGHGNLSDMEKFKICAIFCLEDEIEEIMPRLLERRVLNYQNFSFSKHPMFYYWYCFYKNKFQMIQISEFSINNKVDNWYAKQYFLNSSKYPAQNAMLLLKKYPQLAKLILLALDETQEIIFIMIKAEEIINCLMESKNSEENVVWAWNHKMKNSIDRHQFSSIFTNLIKRDAKEYILKIMWNDVSTIFKHHALSLRNFEMVNLLLHSWKWNETSYFICDILKVAKKKTRKQIASKEFFKDYFKKVITNNLNKHNELFELCFSNDDDIINFKKKLFSSIY